MKNIKENSTKNGKVENRKIFTKKKIFACVNNLLEKV
jgi:hypothetical protein